MTKKGKTTMYWVLGLLAVGGAYWYFSKPKEETSSFLGFGTKKKRKFFGWGSKQENVPTCYYDCHIDGKPGVLHPNPQRASGYDCIACPEGATTIKKFSSL